MTSADQVHSTQVLISNTKGLHGRASALFVKCVQQFDAKITVTRDGETVSGESIMDLLTLAASQGNNPYHQCQRPAVKRSPGTAHCPD